MTEKRNLAAILAADVVGFSRLTGSDEEGTLARLRTLWSDLIERALATPLNVDRSFPSLRPHCGCG